MTISNLKGGTNRSFQSKVLKGLANIISNTGGAETGADNTPVDLRSSTSGSIPIGSLSYSIFNAGLADATVNGAILKPGETTSKEAKRKFDRAIAYDGTGTDLAISYVI